MKALLIFVCILSYLRPLSSQITDSFSDGNLINPAWFGDTDDFIINGVQQLQLSATDKGNSFIYTPYASSDELEINLYTKLNFAPSSSNQLTLFLRIDTPTIDVANGYFIRIGENGSDDNWELYALTNGNESLLLEGPLGDFADDPVEASIQAIFKEESIQVGVKLNENVGFSLQGKVEEAPIFKAPVYFGLLCNYTSTRADKFIFDDLYIGTPLQDIIPPELVKLEVFSDSLILNFSEPLDSISLTLENFQVDQGIGRPNVVSFLGNDNRSLLLTFENPFSLNTTYSLQIDSLRDLAGNTIISNEISFERLMAVPPFIGDLVISEFLPDPTPSQGIPNAEFIEIYNSSDKTIQLKGITLVINNRSSILSESVIKPNEYLILCKNIAVDLFELYGNVLGLADFPIIKNGSGNIVLKSAQDQYLHAATYDASSIKDQLKSKGGWSFEIINPNLYCEVESNWEISQAAIGGTPGSQNSIYDSTFTGHPISLETFLASDSLIHFRLSHNLYKPPIASLFDSLFIINGVSIQSFEFFPPLFNAGHLKASLNRNELYSVKVFPQFLGCNSFTDEVRLEFGVVEKAETGDLSINEVLFNPRTNGADYIEIKNVSNKILNIQSMRVGNRINKDTSSTIRFNFGLLPNSLLCLTTDAANILEEYDVANPKWMHACDLPRLPNSEGHIVLFFDGTEPMLIDEMIYNEDMQHPLLQDPEGVSLERIDCESNSLDRENWHSAAATAGYGTPTGENSQGYTSLTDEIEDKFRIVERIFAPHGMPDQNLLRINYQLDKPGYVCNVSVFDMHGQSIKQLYHQTLLGTQGELIWDGKDKVDNWVSIGRYIFLIDAFHPQGDMIKQKLSCVVANYF